MSKKFSKLKHKTEGEGKIGMKEHTRLSEVYGTISDSLIKSRQNHWRHNDKELSKTDERYIK